MSQPDKQEAMSRLADGAAGVPAPHSPELRSTQCLPLASLHGCRVGVHLGEARNNQVLIGLAEYLVPEGARPLLRVVISNSPVLAFQIEVDTFSGPIRPSNREDCDFLIHVAASVAPKASVGSPKQIG